MAPMTVRRVSTKSRYSAVRAPGTVALNKAAIFFEIVRDIFDVEHDRGVDEGKADNQRRIKRNIETGGGAEQEGPMVCSQSGEPSPMAPAAVAGSKSKARMRRSAG